MIPVRHRVDKTVLPRPIDWSDGDTLDGFSWPLRPPGTRCRRRPNDVRIGT